jgi:lipoate-protein ligase A
MNPLRIRVIEDPPLAGAVNMGRDEALLVRVGEGTSPPTLRFYQWDPPTISLGYFQRYADYQSLPSPAGQLAVVRRPTGGGAILHDRELTYSITVPIDHPILNGGPNRLYEVAHDALIDALSVDKVAANRCGVSDDSGAAKGPFFCFARRHALDVVVGPDKMAGSAQRRTRFAVLQHGSIILERRYDQQPAAAISVFTPTSATTLAAKLTASLARLTGYEFYAGVWENDELTAATAHIEKHRGAEWIQKS